ncbi:PQ-loop domain-containing transporter [Bradyrhizobium sp. Ai1a-2]|uniref:PQ-loop domain-containing transporter n=1 Tax=Bradyrhizobium sp. Ai1a-2 TaxID=196490 RepID=UPI0003F5B79D|nr:PQ-loop domain-containing transporter [Bradyrhizobium sp. Ai1a-2]
MILGDVAYYSFTICNVLRLVSYLPQIHKIARDTNGATAISYSTWILWLAANASTAVYSVSNLGDATMAWTNGLNALCCVIVIMLTALKRRQFHSQIANYRTPAMK